MSTHALFIQHKTRPGCRDEVALIWQRHMAPAISDNPGHIAYAYCFGAEPDTICAFQRYRSEEAAAEFLRTGAYAAYEAEVEPLLEGPPQVTVLDVRWTKREPE